jgi:hypothetical protein
VLSAKPTIVNFKEIPTVPEVVDAVAIPQAAVLSQPVTTNKDPVEGRKLRANVYHCDEYFLTCARNISSGRRFWREAPWGNTRMAPSFDWKLNVTLLPSVIGKPL